MALIVVGLSHRGAPLDVRERVAFESSEQLSALAALREHTGAAEGVLLSTCNRTEIYLLEGEGDAAPVVWDDISRRLGARAEGLGYVYRDENAAAHLFRVAAGLDSMILGEAQIHGQVRNAWEMCRSQSGPVLNRLFQAALLVAGRVRNETAVGRGAASVSSAAVQLSKQIFGSLSGRRAMVLGAGEMAELALECLRDEGVHTAVVVNRTFERAEALARRYGATAIGYDECWSALGEIDLLLCSTAAPHPVVTPSNVRQGLDARGDRPLCILDIAMPRDVDPAVRELSNVFLYNLDDLQAVVAANLDRRRAEVPTAEQVISSETRRFWSWRSGLAAVPVLTRFRSEMDRVRQRELDEALRRLGDLSPEQREQMEHFSRALMNKFLHEPTVRLRAAAGQDDGPGIIDAARYLFALDEADAAHGTCGGKGPLTKNESNGNNGDSRATTKGAD